MILQKNYNRLIQHLWSISLLSTLWFISPWATPALAAKRFVVYVNSDSSLLLEVVQQVQPGATLREYDDRIVIDVGTYFRAGEAENLVKQLEQQGIKAEIADLEDAENFQAAIAALPTITPLPSPENSPIETDVPSALVFPQDNLGLYQVVVSIRDGLLQEVRRVNPLAQEKIYQGRLLIHAGSFVNLENARNLKEELALRRIPADVVQTREEMEVWIALQPIVPAVTSPANPPGSGLGLASQDSYFVLVPGQAQNLAIIQQDLVTLGAPPASVTVQNAFVAVGPFTNENLAQEWESYFLNSGFAGAKVYFGK
ncbi:MAG: hypothetical protein HC835_09075 [Oscillatoriales cyanobacterium RM2_1_1]|nr:hypothetical protein [Oscillatoriales cyanobacterium SM2_3_0]NJO45762.1 hypothetical protein [Oscillatoriales cyanobacterium RM2_1_1]